jgi:hypothetical protein
MGQPKRRVASWRAGNIPVYYISPTVKISCLEETTDNGGCAMQCNNVAKVGRGEVTLSRRVCGVEEPAFYDSKVFTFRFTVEYATAEWNASVHALESLS